MRQTPSRGTICRAKVEDTTRCGRHKGTHSGPSPWLSRDNSNQWSVIHRLHLGLLPRGEQDFGGLASGPGEGRECRACSASWTIVCSANAIHRKEHEWRTIGYGTNCGVTAKYGVGLTGTRGRRGTPEGPTLQSRNREGRRGGYTFESAHHLSYQRGHHCPLL